MSMRVVSASSVLLCALSCATPLPATPPDPSTAEVSHPPSPTPLTEAPLLRTLRRGTGDGPVLVMLHGFGSSPEDLLSFASRTDLPEGTRFVFPYAPSATHPPIGPEGGNMWWPLGEDFHDPRHRTYPGMLAARRRVSELLDALQTEYGISSDRIVLGGFSQGAMLALDVALHDLRPLAGVVLLSGTLVDADEWAPRMPLRRGLPVFQSHGRQDQVLLFAPAEDLAQRLEASGVDVRFLPFEGRHEVTAEVSAALTAFVREVAGDGAH